MGLRTVPCLVVLAVLVPAGAARAASVHVRDAPRDGVSTLVVSGGPGADDLTLRANAGSSSIGPLDITVSDPGAAVAPDGPGCTVAGPHAVHCLGDDGPHAIVRTGAGDDRVRLQRARGGDRIEQVRVALGEGDARVAGNASFLNADGGPGDDVLRGGTGQDRLDGGGGRDDLDGGPSWDVLLDGDDPGHPDADVLDGGGPGQDDIVDYGSRQRGVDVDLMRRRGNGQRGENDRLTHFEGMMGGHGNDRLAGTNDTNYVYGGGGHDVVRGRGGRDHVFADAGAFRLGAGGDAVVFLRFGAGTVACGRGPDLVATV